MDHTTNRDLNRLANLKVVKQQLFNQAAISRAEIARNVNLHKSTISSIFTELDREGYIKHLGRGESTGSGGRKPELFTINAQYGYVACFNITYAHLYVMLLYVNGQEISYQREKLPNHDILTVMELINRHLKRGAEIDDTEHGLLGISFSIHAVVDHNQIIHSPYYDLHGIDLQQYFANHYHVPVIIGNEANLAAIYERDYAEPKNSANFIVLSIHRGPGIGVIANHQLFSGYQGMVGELGSVVLPNRKGQMQEVGDYLSVDFLQDQLNAALGTTDADYSTLHSFDVSGENSVFNDATDQFAHLTSQVLFNLRMLYGPKSIFINSPLIEAMPTLSKKIIHQAAEDNVQVPIKIIEGSCYVSLLGAAAAIIRQVLDLQNVPLHFQWSRKIS